MYPTSLNFAKITVFLIFLFGVANALPAEMGPPRQILRRTTPDGPPMLIDQTSRGVPAPHELRPGQIIIKWIRPSEDYLATDPPLIPTQHTQHWPEFQKDLPALLQRLNDPNFRIVGLNGLVHAPDGSLLYVFYDHSECSFQDACPIYAHSLSFKVITPEAVANGVFNIQIDLNLHTKAWHISADRRLGNENAHLLTHH
ncbi:hypothetical protein C8R42DRAFT_641848 [Lentinula raphanica]|nr:hypothetical protein C8R42DRAFT_641848 [Lentinula raphanica]